MNEFDLKYFSAPGEPTPERVSALIERARADGWRFTFPLTYQVRPFGFFVIGRKYEQ